jgi:hypothetical protein
MTPPDKRIFADEISFCLVLHKILKHFYVSEAEIGVRGDSPPDLAPFHEFPIGETAQIA